SAGRTDALCALHRGAAVAEVARPRLPLGAGDALWAVDRKEYRGGLRSRLSRRRRYLRGLGPRYRPKRALRDVSHGRLSRLPARLSLRVVGGRGGGAAAACL